MTKQHPLNNPIWSSLSTRHERWGVGHGLAKRYPPEVAPFVAVQDSTETAGEDLNLLVKPGERVCILGVTPDLSLGWNLEKHFNLVQMHWQQPQNQSEPDPEIRWIGPEQVQHLLDLTALVYPSYFRKGTAELGDYCGIWQGDSLVAMAGIRMATDGFQEISAVCTHPDHRGQGLAKRLMKHLVSHIQTQGDVPFLHTEAENEQAQLLYLNLGFEIRATLPFWVLTRAQA